jgi:hypothetical protein
MPSYSALSIPSPKPWVQLEGAMDKEFGVALDSDGTEICYSSSGWSAGVTFGKSNGVHYSSSDSILPVIDIPTSFSISIIKDKSAIEGQEYVLSASHGMSMGGGYEAELAVSYPTRGIEFSLKGLGNFLDDVKDATDTVSDVAGGVVTGMLSCDVDRMADAIGRGLYAIAPSAFTASFFTKLGVRFPHVACVHLTHPDSAIIFPTTCRWR